jgi:hypothetical protein
MRLEWQQTFLPEQSNYPQKAPNVFELNISRMHVNTGVQMRREAQRSKWLQDSQLQRHVRELLWEQFKVWNLYAV